MSGRTSEGYGRPSWEVVAGAAATGGTFELFLETRSGLGGPPRHVHRGRGEGFFVLEGRYWFRRGDEELEVGPGDVVTVPAGTAHEFRTLVAPSRTLIVVAPAGLEGFFRGMAERMAAGATALAAMTELSGTFDTTPV